MKINNNVDDTAEHISFALPWWWQCCWQSWLVGSHGHWEWCQPPNGDSPAHTPPSLGVLPHLSCPSGTSPYSHESSSPVIMYKTNGHQINICPTEVKGNYCCYPLLAQLNAPLLAQLNALSVNVLCMKSFTFHHLICSMLNKFSSRQRGCPLALLLFSYRDTTTTNR